MNLFPLSVGLLLDVALSPALTLITILAPWVLAVIIGAAVILVILAVALLLQAIKNKRKKP